MGARGWGIPFLERYFLPGLQWMWMREGGHIGGHKHPHVVHVGEPLPDPTHGGKDLLRRVLEAGSEGGQEGELSQHTGGVDVGVVRVELMPQQSLGNVRTFPFETACA